MFFNVKELDEAYEFAEIVSEIPDPNTCSKAVHDAKAEALLLTWKRSSFYRKEGFQENIVHIIHNKRLKMLREAKTVAEVKEIMGEPKPRYNGNAFFCGQYSIPEEELVCWSMASIKAPLSDSAFKRFMELARQVYGVDLTNLECELNQEIHLDVEDDVSKM